MNSAYNYNLYIQINCSGSLEWSLYTGLTVAAVFLCSEYSHINLLFGATFAYLEL